MSVVRSSLAHECVADALGGTSTDFVRVWNRDGIVRNQEHRRGGLVCVELVDDGDPPAGYKAWYHPAEVCR